MTKRDAIIDQGNRFAPPKINDPIKEDSNPGNVEYASAWLRFAAFFFDAYLCTKVLPTAFLFATSFILYLYGEDISFSFLVKSLLFAVAICVFLYHVGFTTSSYMGTPGKIATRIKVTDLQGNRISTGQAIRRFISKIILSPLFMIGFLIQPFTEKRQALHDMIAGTVVVRKQ